jgi:hypothetical protein
MCETIRSIVEHIVRRSLTFSIYHATKHWTPSLRSGDSFNAFTSFRRLTNENRLCYLRSSQYKSASEAQRIFPTIVF